MLLIKRVLLFFIITILILHSLTSLSHAEKTITGWSEVSSQYQGKPELGSFYQQTDTEGNSWSLSGGQLCRYTYAASEWTCWSNVGSNLKSFVLKADGTAYSFYGGNIQVYTPSTNSWNTLTNSTITGVVDLDIDANGNLYALYANAIYKYSGTGPWSKIVSDIGSDNTLSDMGVDEKIHVMYKKSGENKIFVITYNLDGTGKSNNKIIDVDESIYSGSLQPMRKNPDGKISFSYGRITYTSAYQNEVRFIQYVYYGTSAHKTKVKLFWDQRKNLILEVGDVEPNGYNDPVFTGKKLHFVHPSGIKEFIREFSSPIEAFIVGDKVYVKSGGELYTPVYSYNWSEEEIYEMIELYLQQNGGGGSDLTNLEALVNSIINDYLSPQAGMIQDSSGNTSVSLGNEIKQMLSVGGSVYDLLLNIQNDIQNNSNSVPSPRIHKITGENYQVTTNSNTFRVQVKYSDATHYRYNLDGETWQGWYSISELSYIEVNGIGNEGMHTIYVEIKNGSSSDAPIASGKMFFYKVSQ